MADRHSTSEEKGVRMGRPALLSKLLGRRKEDESNGGRGTERPQNPEAKAVRLYGKPALLSKWYIRRKRAKEKAGEEVAESIGGELRRAVGEWAAEKRKRVSRYVTR